MKQRDALWGAAVLIIIALLGFGAGVFVDQAFPDYVPYFARHSTGKVNTAPLQEAIRLIEAQYVDGSVDPAKLSQGSVQGLIAALNDPYSAYYDPEQYKKLQDSYAGRYSGIGIYLKFSTGYPEITGTVPGSPAEMKGIKAGDQIVKVGDVDMKGATSDKATAAITGPNGTSVTLTLLRAGQTITIEVTRAEITIPSVSSLLIANNILYVRIYSFGSSTSKEFSDALKRGLPGAKGVVLA